MVRFYNSTDPESTTITYRIGDSTVTLLMSLILLAQEGDIHILIEGDERAKFAHYYTPTKEDGAGGAIFQGRLHVARIIHNIIKQ